MKLTDYEEQMWNRFANRWGMDRRAIVDFTFAMRSGSKEDQEKVLKDGSLSDERRKALRGY